MYILITLTQVYPSMILHVTYQLSQLSVLITVHTKIESDLINVTGIKCTSFIAIIFISTIYATTREQNICKIIF